MVKRQPEAQGPTKVTIQLNTMAEATRALRANLDKIASTVDAIFGASNKKALKVRAITRQAWENLMFSARHLVDSQFSDDPVLRGEAYMRMVSVMMLEANLWAQVTEMAYEAGYKLKERVPENLPIHQIRGPEHFPDVVHMFIKATSRRSAGPALEPWEVIYRSLIFAMSRMDDFLATPMVLGRAGLIQDRFRMDPALAKKVGKSGGATKKPATKKPAAKKPAAKAAVKKVATAKTAKKPAGKARAGKA